MTNRYQTLAEIEKQYPDQWVLIDQPKTTRSQELLGGRVLHHSNDKTAVYEKTKDLPTPFNIAVSAPLRLYHQTWPELAAA